MSAPKGLQMRSLVLRFAADESGTTAIEYALIALLMGVTIIGIFTSIGAQLSDMFGKVALGFK